MTLEAVFVFKKILGVQVYVLAPVVDKVFVDDGHTVVFGEVTNVGNGLTVIAVTVPLIQPLVSIPATVYCCVTVGVPVTTDPVVALNPVPGIQE